MQSSHDEHEHSNSTSTRLSTEIHGFDEINQGRQMLDVVTTTA